jgi:hypothetical protein
MWLLTINHSYSQSLVMLLVVIHGITCTQLTMFTTFKTCKATATGDLVALTNVETGSTLPEFPGIVVSTTANQYSTRAPFSFRSLIFHCSCCWQRRLPFSAIQHVPSLAQPSRSHSVGPVCASCFFLYMNTFEICVHLPNPQLEPYYDGKYRASLHAVIHLIYMCCQCS